MLGFALLSLVLAALPLRLEASDLFTTGEGEYLAGGGLGEGGPALETSLLPQDVLAAPDGSVYLADEQFNLVRMVDRDGRVTTVAGDGRYGLDSRILPARQSALAVPAGLALGPEGQLYIVDLGNRQLRVLSGDGHLRPFMGPDHGLVAGSANGFAPYGVATDAAGHVLVADRANHRVWQLDPDGRGRAVAGNGQRGFGGDGGPSALARLADPRAVAVGPDQVIYVADTGNRRVRRVDAQGRIATLAGDGSELSWSGRRPARQASLKPIDLDLDLQGRLLILDELGPRLLRLEADSTLVVLAQFDPGAEPKALSVDRQGRILVADYGQRRVVVVQDQGSPLPLAGNGLLRASGEGGPALNASLYQPFGLAYDLQGNLYIADRRNHLVRRVRPDGIIERVAGTGLPGFGGEGEPARAALLNQPAGLAFDGQGNLYIADSANHRVRKLDRSGNLLTVAGTGLPGFGGEGGPARLALLDQPMGRACDAQGNLYIADSGNHRIRKLDRSGNLLTVAGGGELPAGEGGPALQSALALPVDLSFGPGGMLFVADAGNHRVYSLSPEGLLRCLAGTGERGAGLDGTPATRAALDQPLGLVADGSGGVFVADTGNARLVHIDSDGVLRVVASDTGRPSRLTLDTRGNLVLADLVQHRVTRLPLARQFADAGQRVSTSFSYQIESEAALDQPGLLELVAEPTSGALYLTHHEGVEQVLPTRRAFAAFQASAYRTLLSPASLGPGLLLATPPALGRPQPLTRIAASGEGKPLYLPLDYLGDAADALATAGGRLYLYQQASGQVLRLNERRLESAAFLSAGPALLEGNAQGALYLAQVQSRELWRAEDLDQDGSFTSPGELRRVAQLPERPVALSYGTELFIGVAGGRLYRLGEEDRLEELASGFAPALLDLAATPDGVIHVLEGDAYGGRLLRLSPPAPQVEAWPPRLDFGPLRVGQAGNRQLVLRNRGTLPVELMATQDASLRLSPAASLRLAAGETRTLDLAYTPGARGAQADTLYWRAPGGTALLQVPLSSQGLAPDLKLSAASLDFGAVPVGGEGRQVLALTNPGSAPLQYRLELRGAYRLDRAGEGQLPAGAAMQLPLSFLPAQRRAYADTLLIYTDVPEAPVRRVLLKGRGGQPELAALPASVDLGLSRIGQARRYRLELRNQGEVELHLDQVLTGSRLLLPSPRRLSIPPGQTAAIELSFTPRDTTLVQGELNFTTDDPARPRVRLPFSGRGSRTYLHAAASRHLFSPTAVDQVDSWELVVRNLHPHNTLALQTRAEGPYQIIEAPARLEPGQQGLVRLAFRPTQAGPSRGRLLLNTDQREQLVIALEGRGLAPTLLSLGAPLLEGDLFTIPLQLQEARQLDGLNLELALPGQLEYAGMDFPAEAIAGPPLLLVDTGEAGQLGLGLSFAGPVDGGGLVGLLRLRLVGPSPASLPLALRRAVIRSASGAADTLALPAPLELIAGPAAKAAVPGVLGLEAPYPNPFNAEVVLQYQVPQAQPLSLLIYNTTGQVMRTLYSGLAAAGTYRQVWDGRDQEGRPAGSGIYLAVLRTPATQITRQLLILH
ncbi:MAG: choice-of-anchor D domain-containing protein [Candidatus Latescibacteria bacterium]|nr:choice-of-anchor D domain-containing protein [Candidatus Latescibacterota bacterium]